MPNDVPDADIRAHGSGRKSKTNMNTIEISVLCTLWDAQEKLHECSGTISQTSEADFGMSNSFIIRKNASKKYEDSYM